MFIELLLCRDLKFTLKVWDAHYHQGTEGKGNLRDTGNDYLNLRNKNLKLNLGTLSSDSCFEHQTCFQSLENSKLAMCQGLSLLFN